MVVSAKDTQSDGVRSADAGQAVDPLFSLHEGERWFVAQTLCHREQLAHFTLAPKALGASCLAFARRFAMRAVCAK